MPYVYIIRKSLPKETCTGQKKLTAVKAIELLLNCYQLPSFADCRTEITAMFRGMFGIFPHISKLFVPQFLAEPLTMFYQPEMSRWNLYKKKGATLLTRLRSINFRVKLNRKWGVWLYRALILSPYYSTKRVGCALEWSALIRRMSRQEVAADSCYIN